MKTRLNLLQLTVLLIMAVFAVVHAADVGKDEIMVAARKWIADNAVFQAESPDAVPEKATQLADDDGKAMPLWLVELAPSGYLVMSADDTLPPVAAFNTKGSFEMPVDHPLPSMLVRQGEIFQAELDKPKTRGNELAEENKARWKALLKRTRAETITPSTIVTAPLLTTEWNQRAPYNYFCPSGSSFVERAVTGCVPTAIAQMLKYHEWPVAGTGTKTHTDREGNFTGTLTADFSIPYNWSAMADCYIEKEERDYGVSELEVARLATEMGVLVEVDYELPETGATTVPMLHTLMNQYLGYSSTAVYGDSGSGYIAQETLYSRIRLDMVTGRPAIVNYRQGKDGHCFIADGLGTMAGQDYYHFNYGWGKEMNGWYLLTNGYESTVISSATTNIQPLPIAVFKPISCEQTSSFTLSWDFPKRIAAEAFRLTKTTGTRASTVISSSISGVARSYNLTGQSGTATYTLEAKVNGEWQAASDGVTVTVKTSPATMLSLTVDSNLKSIAGNQVSTVITANNSLANLTITSNRPDILPASGITVTGSGTSQTVRLTPSTGTVGNVFLYVTATDTAGNTLQKTIPLAVMEDEPLVWHTTKAEAFAAAEASGKLVLMVGGRDNCDNTNYFRNTVCETADIKAILLAGYELWYANVEVSGSGYFTYSGDLGSTLPLIAIIDSVQDKRLKGHGGPMSIDAARIFFDPCTPIFSLSENTVYTIGTTQSLELFTIRGGLDIRYRLDGNEPTMSDTLYTEAIPLTATTTVSARAFENGEPISTAETMTFTFFEQVATPVINRPLNGYCFLPYNVTATCATPGATLRYRLDSYIPSASSPVLPAEGVSITAYTFVIVKAFKDGMKESEYTYTYLDVVNDIDGASAVVTGDVQVGSPSRTTTWLVQSSTYASAPSALQSGTVSPGSSSIMAAKVKGPGKLTFKARVSSETQNNHYLSFGIDGTNKTTFYGSNSWSPKEYEITGSGDHVLVWTYYKYGSFSGDGGFAWVDDIVWTPEKTLVEIVITGDNSIAAGGTAAYTCTAAWSDRTTSLVTPTWSLSSTTYASVDENGVVTNKNTTPTDKTVILNASYMGMTAEPKDIILKGQAQPITLVSIAIDGPASIATASTATYTCTATWSDGTTTPVKPTWTFEPTTTYASVSTTGEVVNKNTETTDKTVTLKASYTDNGVTKTDSKGITLAKKELTGVSIVGPDRIVAEGTATYTCTASWTYGESTTETPTWTVEPSTYASVDSTGKVTNKNTTTSEQTVTLTASMTVNGVTKSDSKNITLARENPPDVPMQTLLLTAGWNWVSFNVLPTSHKVGDVLGTAGFSANDSVQTNGGMCLFTGSGWFPGSFDIEYGRLYQIYVASAKTVAVHGKHCEENEFPLTSGWNWIGNPTAAAVSPSQLTHSGGWTAGDRIQSPDGNVMYMGNKWLPANGLTLEPGKGCQIYTTNSGMLSFPNSDGGDNDDALYVIVDLSGGPDAVSYPVRYSATGPDLNDDTCRTTELWLRKIPAGTFIMGSPEDEVGRKDDETQHEVTLTQDYYIGVFECTQRQWELVMGNNPAYQKGDCRPVERVTYNMVRGMGEQTGAGWPTYGHAVDASSFMGKLQAKTGLVFDLPTEAQWEYACRAGTTTSLNSGKDLTSDLSDSSMAEVGRYYDNWSDRKGGYTYTHTKVGSYLSNAWGLYDMHGNVDEWCLDWYVSYGTDSIEDPQGATMGSERVIRGGCSESVASGCRSAQRHQNYTTFSCTDYGFRIAYHPKQNLYAVVDLSGGPDATNYPVRYTDTAPNLDDDTCRTTELWLRKIPAGTFIMGSPEDEVGHNCSSDSDETQHEVTLTQDYYIGVFECTQRQWELIMGSKPSYYSNATYYATRPVEQVSYDMIRGTSATAGAGWPTFRHAVDASSFMGKLQAKTGLTFDLPTEAQWEYACRAGTTTALNSGKNLTSTSSDVAMNEVGRYWYNGGSSYSTTCTTANGTAKVGSYQPNAWGLYDMHGNLWEWCLDWWYVSSYGTDAVSDPAGPNTGSSRVLRGGGWNFNAQYCRSAYRGNGPPSYGDGQSYFGFRIACHPKQDLYAVVDLSGGADAANYPVRYSATGPDLNDDTCRTTELWLRKIPAGTFIMGSLEDEVGRYDDETQHEVTLTQDYYIGVFECTQKQWELVMGSNPSAYKGDCRPVEEVSYNMIRGTGAQAGAGWPTYGHAVDASSFMGKLQAKTGLTFDLPTEAQWEYACRAGTTTALNSGKNLTNTGQDDAMDEVGRYGYNRADGKGGYSQHTKVGSYLPNAWGLYDMHGNVGEWCLDRYGPNYYGISPKEDPTGPDTGSYRLYRGGCWGIYSYGYAQFCRSASRYGSFTPGSYFNNLGFRLVCLPAVR